MNRKGGAEGSCPFWSKTTENSVVWAGALINHPSWNGQTRWKSLQKKFTEAEHSLSQQRQLVHWYRWVPRTLTSQGSLYCKGPSLQKIILAFFWFPMVHYGISLFSKAPCTKMGYYLEKTVTFLKSRRMTSKIWSLRWLYFSSLLSVEVKINLSFNISRGWNHF